MRFLKSYGIAFLIVLGIATWMITGTLVEGGRGPGQGERPMIDVVDGDGGPLRGFLEAVGIISSDEEEQTSEAVALAQTEPEPVMNVRVVTSNAEDMPLIISLRGRTQANAVVAARAETSGIVRQVHVTKGEFVNEGDLLCTLNQGTRQAQLSTAEAALEQARADLENNRALRERGVAPANTARQFEVALLSAQANYDEALTEFERTEIHAEVSGIIEDPLVTVGSLLSAGSECATIVQLDPMVFIGEVAEARVGLLDVGEDAMITTVTGQEAVGRVRFVSATANQASRTFGIEIEIPNADSAIRDGITAEAFIQVGSEQAHLLPQSALTLDSDGVLGIRTVEEGNIVAFHPIEILRDTRDGVWLTGLPDTAEVITLGQEYVQSGQTVRVSRGDEA
ncbi:efflux RND transporter periplasmic adaptor subunit [Pelagibacterium lentulum]|nr:efflux RND transporter periplasmic adaptor subunit [Pelagibacterium lentulum]